jgi:hypothetical protein
MEARFEDILHLLAYNGYAEDIRQAVAVNRLTWTDDRIWYPYLIAERFGSMKRGRLHIIAEHKRTWSNEENLMARFNELEKMASSSHHMKLFLAQIDVRDIYGKSALTAAIENRCPKAVEFLVTRGADINQIQKNGRSALNLAKSMKLEYDDEIQNIKKPDGRIVAAHVPQKRSQKIIDYLTKLGAVDIPEQDDHRFGIRMRHYFPMIIQNPPRMRNNQMCQMSAPMSFDILGLNRSIPLRTHDMNPPKP